MIKRGYRTMFVLALGCAAGGAFARGPWRANAGNTPGWPLMSPAERIEHQARVRGFRTHDDCLRHREDHLRLIALRARAAGREVAGGPDFCAHLQARTDQP